MDSLPGIKQPTNNSQISPSLYNALSMTSGGFLNTKSTQQPAGGPPGSPGFGPSSSQSPTGDNLFVSDNVVGRPSPMSPSLNPSLRSNPVASYGDNTSSDGTAIRSVQQQGSSQEFGGNRAGPFMPDQSLYRSLRQGGNQGQPQRQFNTFGSQG